MSQETRVIVIAPLEAQALQARLRAQLTGEAEWRPVPYAQFSVKSDGVVATMYQSGKLVLQGPNLDAWLSRYLPTRVMESPQASTDSDLPFDRPIIGSDEVGKGDYFGPLVVVAAFADPAESAGWMRQIGIADSKVLSDQRIQALAGQIEKRIDHEIVMLEPVAYNERYEQVRNVNILLAELHAKAIAALSARHPDASALVDQFARKSVIASELAKLGAAAIEVRESVRAERHPVVATASILARAAFLDGLARCSDEAATDLHKGAGAPVDVAAKRVVAIGGRGLLAKVAKMHFKNTLRVDNHH